MPLILEPAECSVSDISYPHVFYSNKLVHIHILVLVVAHNQCYKMDIHLCCKYKCAKHFVELLLFVE